MVFREADALAWTRRRTAAAASFLTRAARVRFSRRQLRHGGGRRRLCRRYGGRRVLFRIRRAGARKPAHVVRLGFLHPAVLHRERRGVRSPSLVSSPANIVRLLLFTLAFLLIRIPPLGIYKNALAKSDLPALALLSSTTLPLVVAISYLGGKTGQMTPKTLRRSSARRS